MTTLSLELIDVPHSRIGEAVDVLAFAFENDPSLQYAFWANKPTYRDLLQEYFRFLCEVRYQLDWPVKGSVVKGKLVGAELITPPEPKDWTPKLNEMYESFKWYVGPVATERLEKFSELVKAHKPQEPHYFLSTIGVHPSVQGKGHARALVEALHKMSVAHPESTGVYLDTSNPVNVPKYEHLGYRTIATEQVGDVTVWYMFRPNDQTGE
jgi:ribosomal protein S18 acetylase RimI-like enzyme